MKVRAAGLVSSRAFRRTVLSVLLLVVPLGGALSPALADPPEVQALVDKFEAEFNQGTAERRKALLQHPPTGFRGKQNSGIWLTADAYFAWTSHKDALLKLQADPALAPRREVDAAIKKRLGMAEAYFRECDEVRKPQAPDDKSEGIVTKHDLFWVLVGFAYSWKGPGGDGRGFVLNFDGTTRWDGGKIGKWEPISRDKLVVEDIELTLHEDESSFSGKKDGSGVFCSRMTRR